MSARAHTATGAMAPPVAGVAVPCLSGLSLHANESAPTGMNQEEMQRFLYASGGGPSTSGGSLEAADAAHAEQLQLEALQEEVLAERDEAIALAQTALDAAEEADNLSEAAEGAARTALRAQQVATKATKKSAKAKEAMTGGEEWLLEMKEKRAEALANISQLLAEADWRKKPPTKREEEKLLRDLKKAYEQLNKSSTSWEEIGLDRKAYDEHLELVEKNLATRRKMVIAIKHAKKGMATYLTNRAKYREWKSKRPERAKKRAALARRNEVDRRREALAAEQARAAAAAAAQQAQEAKTEACENALCKLHELRAKLKVMAEKFAGNLEVVNENCEPAEGAEEMLDPWMMEMLTELAKLQGWIETREAQSPDDWDVEGHAEALENCDIDVGGESDDDGEEEEADDEFDGEEEANEDDVDFADEAEDEGWEAAQVDIILELPLEDAPDAEGARKAGTKIAMGVKKFLETHPVPASMNIPVQQNLYVSLHKAGEMNITIWMTEALIQEGRDTPEGQETPRDKLDAFLLGLSAADWTHMTGTSVLGTHEGGEAAGIPDVTDAEGQWLDKAYPNWDEAHYSEQLVMVNMAKLAVERAGASSELADFKPTEEEIEQVYLVFKGSLGIPRDWFTNPNMGEQFGIDDAKKLMLLQGIRHGFDAEGAGDDL